MAKSICSVDGCERVSRARGWCDMHWQRWRKRGTTDLPARRPYYLPGENGCWIWQRELDTKGYGMYRLRGGKRVKRAHRWVYEQYRGPIPAGLELDHLCRVPACVNPDHLEPVTHAENVRRGMAPSAITRRTNRCKRGHELTPDNTVQRKDWRTCRTCLRASHRRYYSRKSRTEDASAEGAVAT